MKTKKGILDSNLFYTVLAIIIGFAIGAIFLMIAGISPAVAYGKLLDSVFSKPKYLVWTLLYGAPVIFTGLSVAFSFRTGVFNIGAEGQYIVGSVAACVVGIKLQLPPIIHPLVCLLAAAAAGCLWSLIVGILKTTRGIHEVLSFIMFNWIAYYFQNYVVNLPGIRRQSGGEATENVADAARILLPEGLMKTLDCSGANWGFIFASLAAIIIFIIIEKTTLGYELKAVGFNKNAAEFAGINVNRSMLTALGISGALAGLGGAVQVLGMGGRLSQLAAQEGFGFDGITVALIAGSNPLGCILSGLFYGAMKYGGSKLTIVRAPSEVVNIIMGCVIIFIAISQVFKVLFTSIGKKKEA